jgi:hypothetical protein
MSKNGDLAKSLNTLRTIPGAPNPFVVSPRRESGSTSAGDAGNKRFKE